MHVPFDKILREYIEMYCLFTTFNNPLLINDLPDLTL